MQENTQVFLPVAIKLIVNFIDFNILILTMFSEISNSTRHWAMFLSQLPLRHQFVLIFLSISQIVLLI